MFDIDNPFQDMENADNWSTDTSGNGDEQDSPLSPIEEDSDAERDVDPLPHKGE